MSEATAFQVTVSIVLGMLSAWAIWMTTEVLRLRVQSAEMVIKAGFNEDTVEKLQASLDKLNNGVGEIRERWHDWERRERQETKSKGF